jgi:hypothetical protein
MNAIQKKFPFPFSRFTSFFLFLFSLFTLVLSCSSPTETPRGDLTGVVNLEGETDPSNITVALYDLAVLDPDSVSVNQQYPHIGVIITQHTEFDHRLQEPVKYTETDAEGYFEIKKIPTGTYNIVALKDSFGFKYIYEINIQDGENELSNSQLNHRLSEEFSQRHSTKSLSRTEVDIVLYQEQYFSGYFEETSTTFYTDHHYIIEDDTALLPDQSLTIEPGTVIRINPGVDLTIHGTLTAQGEENNMFWVTSNDGFAVSRLTSHVSREDLLQYNSTELSSIATVSDDLIEWGKFDYANTCLLNQVNNLHIQNGIFRNGNCGFYSSGVDSTFCENLICDNIIEQEAGGIYYLNVLEGNIQSSIFYQNYNGNKIKDEFEGLVHNNYYLDNQNGIELWHFVGTIQHCEFYNNSQQDIKLYGNNEPENRNLNFEYNIFSSDVGVSQYYFSFVYDFINLLDIHDNNFSNSDFFIEYYPDFLNHDIYASNNYYTNISNIEQVYQKIRKKSNEPGYTVIIENIYFDEIANAGIE